MRRAVTTLALMLTGCTSMEPAYVRPDPAVPQSWPAGDAYLRQSEASLPAVTYRDIFRDLRLQALIGQALSNNKDLQVAAANIAAARARYRIQRAQQFPQVDASAGASAQPRSGGSGVAAQYTAGVNVPSYEIDFFGRLASLTGAQFNQYLATEAGARTTRLTLVADVADAWLQHAADATLLKIAEDTAMSAQRSVRLTRARLEGGIAPRTDLTQAQQILETASADVASQRTALAQDVNLLQLLVGQPIDPALLESSIEDAAANLAELPAGLDSHVLLRRPDVVQAEYQLRAANADIGAARAALFPKITLTGLLGLASSALTGLFSGGAFAWSAGTNVAYPIFNAGASRENVRLAEADRDAAVANYQKTIQTAYRDVADALARRGTMGEQLRARKANTAAAGETYRLDVARYEAGIDPFLESLVAQRSYYAAQQQLALTRLAAASNLVDLYRALGGETLYPPLVPRR